MENQDFIISNGILIKYLGTSNEVVIPEGVTEIADEAFKEKGLDKVTFPSSLLKIGSCAFYGNKLTSVDLPPNLKILGCAAFRSNQLTSIKIPNSVTSLEGAVFADNKITDYTLPIGVKVIPISLFANNLITNAIIPDSVEEIEEGAFYNNVITAITFGQNLRKIGYLAFQKNYLQNLNIPPSVTYISPDAFKENQIHELTVSPNLETLYNIGDYHVLNICSSTTVKFLPFHTLEELNIEFADSYDEYTIIPYLKKLCSLSPDKSFFKTKLISLYNVSLTPKQIQKIKEELGLKTNIICLPTHFNNAERLTLEDDNWSIQNGILYEYKGSDTSITIPSGVQIIAPRVFEGKNLEYVNIPNSVVHIGPMAFTSNHLKEVILPPNLQTIGAGAFSNNELTNIFVPESTIAIGHSAFKDNPISKIVIPKSVLELGIDITSAQTVHIKARQLKHEDIQFYNAEEIIFDDAIQLYYILPNITSAYLPSLKTVTILNQSKLSLYQKLVINLGVSSHCKIVYLNQSPAKTPKTLSTPTLPPPPVETVNEIDSLVSKIKKITSLMNEKDKIDINQKVDAILDSYKKGLLDLKPKLNFDNEPTLTIFSNPTNLKDNTINSLNSILSSLAMYNELISILNLITNFANLKPLNLNLTHPNLEQELQYLKFVIQKYNHTELNAKLDEVFAIAKNKIKKSLKKGYMDTELTEEDVAKQVEQDINSLYNIAYKYHFIKSIISGTVNIKLNEDEEALSLDIAKFREILTNLDSKSYTYFITKLESIDISFALLQEDISNIIKYIRKQLALILAELQETAFNTVIFKSILEELNASQKIIDGYDIQSESSITSLVTEIMFALHNNNLPPEIENDLFIKVSHILTTWYMKITNMDYQALKNSLLYFSPTEYAQFMYNDLKQRVKNASLNNSADYDTLKSYLSFYEQECNQQASVLFSNISNFVTIQILKELFSVKDALLDYLAKRETYEKNL